MPRLIATDGLEAYVGQITVYFTGSMYAQMVKEWEGGRIVRVYKKVKEEREGQMVLIHVFYIFVRPHTRLTVGKGRGKQNALRQWPLA